MKITNIQNILFLSPTILIGAYTGLYDRIPAYRRLFREYTLKKSLRSEYTPQYTTDCKLIDIYIYIYTHCTFTHHTCII